MKAFKKLMAAALVCVMALTVLTGCAVGDNMAESALVKKLNDVSTVEYTHNKDLDDEAKKAWDESDKKAGSGTVVINNTIYNYVIVKKPSDASKKNSWGTQADTVNKVLKDSKQNGDKKIEIGVKVCGDDSNYVAVVAKV